MHELLELMAALTNDLRFEEAVNQSRGGTATMCEVLDKVENRGIEKGRTEQLLMLVKKIAEKKYTAEEIASLFEEDLSVIQPMYDLIKANPDKEAAELYQLLTRKPVSAHG